MNNSGSFRRVIQRKEEKWWLPVPRVPPSGLAEKSRKQLKHKRECANQILKAAMVINSSILDEMEVPETYLATLPKVSAFSFFFFFSFFFLFLFLKPKLSYLDITIHNQQKKKKGSLPVP